MLKFEYISLTMETENTAYRIKPEAAFAALHSQAMMRIRVTVVSKCVYGQRDVPAI